MKNTDKRNRHGYTKEEIKENRKKALENPLEEIVKPTLLFWKEHTAKAIGLFFMWVAIVYIIMTGLQAINYDMMYCDSSIDKYDGKIMRVYNPFVEEMNTRMENFRIGNQPMLMNIQPQQLVLPQSLNQTINCGYNLTRWWHDDSDLTHNIKELVIKRWVKNKDTN